MRLIFAFLLVGLTGMGSAFGQDATIPSGPGYLQNSGSALFARSIATPTTSLSGPALLVGASNATQGLIAGAENANVEVAPAVTLPAIDLFPVFYGDQKRAVTIEPTVSPTEAEEPPSTPAYSSLHNIGIGQATTAESLRRHGYGVTLAEAAASSKAAASHGSRVYTNADIDRMHGPDKD